MKTNGILESYQEFTQIGHFNCFTSVADPGQIHLKQILQLPQRPVVVSADGALSQLLYDAWLLAVSLLRQEVPPAGDWLLTIHPSGHQSGTHCLGSQNHGAT